VENIQKALLSLVRYGLGKEGEPVIPEVADWEGLFKLAQAQGLTAVALDGINICYEKGRDIGIDLKTKMEWIGAVCQMESVYKQYVQHVKGLSSFYQSHGIRMMVLKGYGLSLNYPRPNHRPTGDIDIYLFGEQKKADRLVHDELGIEIDKSHHHHTVFEFQGETVENHYDFLNVHVRPSNKRIEAKLKELAHTDITSNINSSDNLIFPSAEFNAIYLLRHCAAHFASTKMSVRQALDWGLFMEKHHSEMDWKEYMSYLKEERMFRFYNLLGLFCVSYLGFDSSIFHGLYSDALFERFVDEILSPEFKDKENGTLLRSLSVKPRRWWHNRWKNRLCYPDSPWSEFVYGLWAKILKPSHFIQ
jgi:hypothetical protein